MPWLSKEVLKAALVAVWRAVVAALLAALTLNGGLAPGGVQAPVVSCESK